MSDYTTQYKALTEKRNALVAKYNETEGEELRSQITNEINEVDAAFETLVERADADAKAAELRARAAEIAMTSTPETVKNEESEVRQMIRGELNRRSVEVPSFMDADTTVGTSVLGDSDILSWLNLFDLGFAPYREYTENVHVLSDVTWAAASEGATITQVDPAYVADSSVTVTKAACLIGLTNEVLENIPQAESQLISKINLSYAKLLRNDVTGTINGATNTVTAAATTVTTDEVFDLFAAVTAEDKSDFILLASNSAYFDLKKDAGNDNFYFDPVTGLTKINGTTIVLAPGIGSDATGQTAVVALNPKAVSVRASGLRVAQDADFDNDGVKFRGTVYNGSAINSQDHVARLVRG